VVLVDIDGGDGGNAIIDSGAGGTKLNGGTDGVAGYVLIAPTNSIGVRIGSTVAPTVALDVTGDIVASGTLGAGAITGTSLALGGGAITNAINTNWDLAYASYCRIRCKSYLY